MRDFEQILDPVDSKRTISLWPMKNFDFCLFSGILAEKMLFISKPVRGRVISGEFWTPWVVWTILLSSFKIF